MTTTQRKQLAQILLKEGEEGWRVCIKHITDSLGRFAGWLVMQQNHTVDHRVFHYKAERIERTTTRTPLPIEHYRRGMEVTISEQNGKPLVIGIRQSMGWIITVLDNSMPVSYYAPSRITNWRWPNETEWKPAFTETIEEKIVETLIVEGL